MDTLDFVSVPIIVTAVYTVITLLKRAVGSNEKFEKFIPLIAVVLGAVLGVVGYYSGLVPAANVFSALMIGGSSGLAATGTHQIFKQLSAKSGTEDNSSATGVEPEEPSPATKGKTEAPADTEEIPSDKTKTGS